MKTKSDMEFTKQEIEKIKEEFNTDLLDFKIIEVNNELN